tara:strand:+ start:1272 stop:1808 length:537 start_codon:yes stop_codon:yes gene_type:complete
MALPTTDQKAALDLLATAPPGISLTQENTNYPWGNPPKHSDPDKAMTAAIDSLENPTTKANLLKLLFAGVSIESLIEGFIHVGFETGKFSLDTGLLIKGPLGLYLANLAEEEGVPYRLFENENAIEEDDLDDAHVLKIMKMNNPAMFQVLQNKVNQSLRQGKKLPKDVDKGFVNKESK